MKVVKIKSIDNILLAINFHHQICSSDENPNRVLYTIVKSDKRYSVKYHGCCEVELADTYQEAYSYILKKLRYIVQEDGHHIEFYMHVNDV